MQRRVHVVGAGLAGLACAVRLTRAGMAVTLHEAAGHAGGRCRSYHDPVLDREIDNGNHLILSGNRAVLAYVADCGAEDELWGPDKPLIPFLDLRTGERWTIHPNTGRVPWWLASASRRAPDGGLLNHLRDLSRLRRSSADDTVAGLLGGSRLFPRFWKPLAVSILNTPADRASAALFWRTMAESLALGGGACRPLFTRHSLSRTFVDPALATLQRARADIRLGNRLRAIEHRNDRPIALDFAGGKIQIEESDRLILAVPPDVAGRLLPDLAALAEPFDHNPILNAHFRLEKPMELPGGLPFVGITNSEWVEWMFVRGEMLSVTLSAAGDRIAETPEAIAQPVWREVRTALGLDDGPLPPCRIVTEKRATIAQTPAQAARRPAVIAPGGNILLAGDWTDTGLPCTIEGAIRSGHAAATAILTAGARPGPVTVSSSR